MVLIVLLGATDLASTKNSWEIVPTVKEVKEEENEERSVQGGKRRE
jgi:hypothetical protein